MCIQVIVAAETARIMMISDDLIRWPVLCCLLLVGQRLIRYSRSVLCCSNKVFKTISQMMFFIDLIQQPI